MINIWINLIAVLAKQMWPYQQPLALLGKNIGWEKARLALQLLGFTLALYKSKELNKKNKIKRFVSYWILLLVVSYVTQTSCYDVFKRRM